MSLVQQCLEAFDGYITGYSMNAADAAKYTMESGALMIEMESIAALDEIYAADFALESEMVHAVAEAKQMGIPVEEGLATAADKIKDSLAKVWNKVKEWLKKLKDTIFKWFENIKNAIRDMFKKPKEVVESNKSEIDSAKISTSGNRTTITTSSGKSSTAEILTYEYTNIDDYPAKQASVFERLSGSIIGAMDEHIKKVTTGAPKSWAGANETREMAKYYEEQSNELKKQAEKVKEAIDKQFGGGDDGRVRHLSEFAYFRNGAIDESKKTAPKLSMSQYRAIVADSDKIEAGVKSMQQKIDKIFNNCINSVRNWEKSATVYDTSNIVPLGDNSNRSGHPIRGYGKPVNTKLSAALSEFTSMVQKLHTCNTERTSAWITASKERAAVAYQICKRAISSP
ncbi:MAG: hypothetical protein NC548_29790 [Lachnospiraceae bacterium]|nr:hypothetical protein [Lachnospiraceae bacterium]